MSPVLKTGTHPVEVINPGGKRGILEDVLIYTDDPVLLGDAPAPKHEKPSRVSSSPLLSKARSFSSWGRTTKPVEGTNEPVNEIAATVVVGEKRVNGEAHARAQDRSAPDGADDPRGRRKTLFSMSDLRAGGGPAPTFSSRSSSGSNVTVDDLSASATRHDRDFSNIRTTKPARLSLVPGMAWGKPS